MGWAGIVDQGTSLWASHSVVPRFQERGFLKEASGQQGSLLVEAGRSPDSKGGDTDPVIQSFNEKRVRTFVAPLKATIGDF